MKKYGGFVPGIRPGRATSEYLDYILSRITSFGALYLGLVAVLPLLLFNLTAGCQPAARSAGQLCSSWWVWASRR